MSKASAKKIRKFFTSPSLFWRDYLLKRNPVKFTEEDMFPARKAQKQLAGPTRASVPAKPVAKVAAKPAAKAGAKPAVNPAAKPGKPASKPAPPKRNHEAVASIMAPSPGATQREIIQGQFQTAFPIDIVFTWVDGDDPDFIMLREAFRGGDVSAFRPEAVDHARFQSRDELRYAVRSIWLYAPRINHIYIVTNGQVPHWFMPDNEKVTIVPHSQIIPQEYLPTFNSHVIETCLHRIPGLSEHYLYLNDDVMITRRLDPSYFFTENGLAYLFPTKNRLPNGPRCVMDTPTQWGAKNARDLIYNKYGVFFDTMYAHTFHPQLRSIAEKNEVDFAEAVHQCRLNKFRSETDLLFTSFLNHNVAYYSGRALLTSTRCFYFNVRTPQAKRYYEMLLLRQGTDAAPHSMCLNDHISTLPLKFPDYEVRLRRFLDSYFPFPSPYEFEAPIIQPAANAPAGSSLASRLLEIVNGDTQAGQADTSVPIQRLRDLLQGAENDDDVVARLIGELGKTTNGRNGADEEADEARTALQMLAMLDEAEGVENGASADPKDIAARVREDIDMTNGDLPAPYSALARAFVADLDAGIADPAELLRRLRRELQARVRAHAPTTPTETAAELVARVRAALADVQEQAQAEEEALDAEAVANRLRLILDEAVPVDGADDSDAAGLAQELRGMIEKSFAHGDIQPSIDGLTKRALAILDSFESEEQAEIDAAEASESADSPVPSAPNDDEDAIDEGGGGAPTSAPVEAGVSVR